jgi:hypothetical protein
MGDASSNPACGASRRASSIHPDMPQSIADALTQSHMMSVCSRTSHAKLDFVRGTLTIRLVIQSYPNFSMVQTLPKMAICFLGRNARLFANSVDLFVVFIAQRSSAHRDLNATSHCFCLCTSLANEELLYKQKQDTLPRTWWCSSSAQRVAFTLFHFGGRAFGSGDAHASGPRGASET